MLNITYKNDIYRYQYINTKNKKNKFNNIYEKKQFTTNLLELEQYLINNNKFIKMEPDNVNNYCIVCKKHIPNLNNVLFQFKNILWNDTLMHYLQKHNIEPSEEFCDIVYNYKFYKTEKPNIIKFKKNVYIYNDYTYLKLSTNQLHILDSLMDHGGRKIYKGISNFKYSEHVGYFDFTINGLNKIILSANTKREFDSDPHILFPDTAIIGNEIEYMFHTHPPTPTYGYRAKYGILYEAPSSIDILNFVYKHNSNKIQGSIVISPEGFYNIRTNDFRRKKIRIPAKFKTKIDTIFFFLNDICIKKYGTNFTKEFFLSVIAKDLFFINSFNEYLEKYNIHIDYFSREKNEKHDFWFINTIYLPIYIKEKYS